MFLTNKTLINSKWLILSAFFLLIVSFASIADVYEKYCLGLSNVRAQCVPNFPNCQTAEACEKEIISSVEKIMLLGEKNVKSVIECSRNLKKTYRIEASGAESSKTESDDESSGSDSDTRIVQLKEDCNKAKQSAAECCSNPNACNGFAKDLIQHILPLTPALYSAYKSYKVSSKAGKGELTHEEARDKMCHSANKVSLGVFGTSLLSQMMPMFNKTCGKRISACKSTCNNHVNNFKKEFRNCYEKLFPGKNISGMIEKAKSCFELKSSLDDEDFDGDINIKIGNQPQIYSNVIASGVHEKKPKTNKCYFFPKDSFNMKEGFYEKESVNPDPLQTVALSELLYIAKAYKKTTGKDHLSENSNEKEVIDCGHQPDRVLDSSYKPGGPIPPPAIQLCKSAVDYAVNKTSPSMPTTPSNQANNVGQASLAGNTKSSNMASLNVPAGDECQYGVLDSESLENCPISPVSDDLPDSPNKPALAKNLPSWKGGGGGSPNGSSGGGGIGSGGAGSLGGNSSGDRDGSMYPPGYSGDMSADAGFTEGYESDSYGDGGGSNSAPYRELAEDSDDDSMPDGMEMPFDEEENPNGEKSIFQLASERIRNFCSDYSCDK